MFNSMVYPRVNIHIISSRNGISLAPQKSPLYVNHHPSLIKVVIILIFMELTSLIKKKKSFTIKAYIPKHYSLVLLAFWISYKWNLAVFGFFPLVSCFVQLMFIHFHCLYYFIFWIYYDLFIYPTIDGHLCCLRFEILGNCPWTFFCMHVYIFLPRYRSGIVRS